MDKMDYIDIPDISDEIDLQTRNSTDDEKFISIVDDVSSDTNNEIESVVVLRTCKDCKKDLVLNSDNYYVHKSCSGGFHPRCKPCHNKKYLFESPLKNRIFLRNISLVDGSADKIEKDILSLEKLLDKKKNNLEKVKNKPEKVIYSNYVVTIPNNCETEFLKYLDDSKLKYRKNKTSINIKDKK